MSSISSSSAGRIKARRTSSPAFFAFLDHLSFFSFLTIRMASTTNALHLPKIIASVLAKPPTFCDACKKCVDIPSQCASLSEVTTAPSPHQSTNNHPRSLEKHQHAGHLDCSICLDACYDPVVTLCGHLFCWPCLYCWLSLHSVSEECPVCRANVHGKFVPVYGHMSREEQSVHSTARTFLGIEIPSRPLHHRSSSALTSSSNHDNSEHNHAIQEYEMLGMRGSNRLAVRFANAGFLASLLKCGKTLLLPSRGGFLCERQAHFGASSALMRRRNEKELILHWAFICVASVASLGLILC